MVTLSCSKRFLGSPRANPALKRLSLRSPSFTTKRWSTLSRRKIWRPSVPTMSTTWTQARINMRSASWATSSLRPRALLGAQPCCRLWLRKYPGSKSSSLASGINFFTRTIGSCRSTNQSSLKCMELLSSPQPSSRSFFMFAYSASRSTLDSIPHFWPRVAIASLTSLANI